MPSLTGRQQAWLGGIAAVVLFIGYPAYQVFDVERRIVEYFDPQGQAGSANLSGISLRDDGKLDEAIARFDKAIALVPGWHEPYVERGIAWRRKGDTARALADFDRSIALKDEAKTHYERAVTYRATGDLDRAVADLGDAVRIDPAMADAYFMRATIARERGDVAGTMADLDQAISRRGDKADWLSLRGMIALFELDRPAQAGDDFVNAARAAMNYRGFRKMLDARFGDVKTDSGRIEMMDYEHAWAPDGLYLFLWAHAARVHAGQDDRAEMAALAHELAQPIWREIFLKRQIEAMSQPRIDMKEVGRKVEEEAQQTSRAAWPGIILGLFLGKSTPEAVRTAAALGDDGVRSRQSCDADAYIAIHHLANGESDVARALLRSAADRCPAATFEARLAKSELARLVPER